MTDLIDRMDAALAGLEANGLLGRAGATGAEIGEAEAAARRTMPMALRQIYQRANGIDFEQLSIFDLGDYVVFNELPARFDELPGAVIFATDRGDGIYFLDPDNALGEGGDAVYFAQLGSLAADLSRPAAADIARFVEAAAKGKSLDQGPDLRVLSLDRLLAAIGDNPGTVQLKEPLSALGRARLDLVNNTPILSAFYEHSDGISIPQADVEIGGAASIAAVGSSLDASGRPGCLHIGRVGALDAYTTTGGWRGLPTDRLLLAAGDEEVGDAAPLGRVSDVLRAFVQGGGAA